MMRLRSTSYRALAGLLLCNLSAFGAASTTDGPELDSKEIPRLPAVEPADAPGTFQVKPGFRAELVAAEPLVMDPIALSFDENGRMFVVEMRDYSERRDEQLGRIRVLEDTNGDGRFDKSTVFADELAWPTAVICYGGGVFVGATPDILFLKDSNGDGVADVRELVFTGFAHGVPRLNVQQLLNSFAWGLDNRIHGANGGSGGSVTSPKRPGDKALELRGRDFSFDPRTYSMRAESGGGQYGLSFNDRGQKFVCSNSSHIRAVLYEDRYAGRNRFFPLPPPSTDIAVDGPAAEVYRISPDEPWRVIRTQWRVAGMVPGPIEGGGRASGYFTSATGIMIYRGDAWPENYRGDAFVADCGSNLLHRKKVYADGVLPKAERPPDEQKVEFLASRDIWFRPVQLANAPDGTLHVIDMYREVIEHPWSLPPSLKKHLDLNSGNDRGRIYRIVPEHFAQRSLPNLGHAPAGDLARTLEHPNGWHRDTAARLIFERREGASIPELRRLLDLSKSPLARMHSLYALAGLGALSRSELARGLRDGAAEVRQHSLRLLEELPDPDRRPLLGLLQELAQDPDPLVRYQLAFTVGEIQPPNAGQILCCLARVDAADPWMRVAVLHSLRDAAERAFLELVDDSEFMTSSGSEVFLQELATVIGAQNRPEGIERVMTVLTRQKGVGLACSLAYSLGEGVQRAGSSLGAAAHSSQLTDLRQKAEQLLGNQQARESDRLAALRLIGQAPFAQARATLNSMLKPGQAPNLQKAAVRVLASFSQPEVSEDLLEAWEGLTPALRGEVIEGLLRRPERVKALFASLESGRVRPADLVASQVELLRKHPDSGIRQRANELLGRPPAGNRQDVVNTFAAALDLSGRAAPGQQIYSERCASCHRLAGQGHALGPDLETVRSSGKETLLANIIDPNREVMPKYVNYLAETRDGESIAGLIAAENEASVTLRQANSFEMPLLRSDIEQLRSLGQSAMPENLEEGLSAQDMADLLEYVLSARAEE